jgi:lipopolysaccharide export system permease protein
MSMGPLRGVFGPLDRYVFREFWRIFLVSAIGFPVLTIVIDLTDNLDKYLERNLPKGDIALAYLYWLPESAFLVMPAAVLFATVFSIGSFTRHSEITAAKASGISFYRMVVPIFVGAFIATGLGLLIGEISPTTNQRRAELLRESQFTTSSQRFNFAIAGDGGRVYKITQLNGRFETLQGLELERRGSGPEFPTYVLTADAGEYDRDRGWLLRDGYLHVVPDSGADFAVKFDSSLARGMDVEPRDLLSHERDPEELSYEDLGTYIQTLERSGGNADKLRVGRMLKIAIPVTCIIIALFGAPLATSSQRGGAAYGVGISLGTTILFLLLIQLTRAIGSSGVIKPELAAWIPGLLFGLVGLVLLWRVRT